MKIKLNTRLFILYLFVFVVSCVHVKSPNMKITQTVICTPDLNQ